MRCYGYDKDLGLCIIFGSPCSGMKNHKCWHENEEQWMEILEEEIDD